MTGDVLAPQRDALVKLVTAVHRGERGSIVVRENQAVLRPATGPADDEQPLTDLGNARRLVARHGQDIRRVHGVGWLVWNEHRWAADVDGAVMRRAKETITGLYRAALDELAVVGSIADDRERQRRVTVAQRQLRHALHSQAEPRLDAMISLAESEIEVIARVEDLDKDLMLLGCMNNTVDLRTGTSRVARREDLITRLTGVSYDAAATAPLWEKFLTRRWGAMKI